MLQHPDTAVKHPVKQLADTPAWRYFRHMEQMPVRFRLHEILEARQPALSQRELARLSGVSPTTINAMVQNKTRQVSLSTLDSLCAVLGVAPGDLLEREPPKRDRR